MTRDRWSRNRDNRDLAALRLGKTKTVANSGDRSKSGKQTAHPPRAVPANELVEKWLSIPSPASLNTVLVVNADEVLSEGAGALREIIDELPVARRSKYGNRLFCLGNPISFPLDEFQERGADWLNANKGRLPIIGPILDSIDGEEDFFGAIITSGKIYDWEDWDGTVESQRFARVEAMARTQASASEGNASATSFGIACQKQLRSRRPRKIVVAGRSFFPFYWTNRQYAWADGCLTAEKADNFACEVGYLSLDDESPAIQIVDGEGRISPLEAKSSMAQLDIAWMSLDQSESRVVESCLTTGSYTCPFCQSVHEKSYLKCRKSKGSVLGKSVLPTLEHFKGAGYIQLRSRNGFVEYSHQDCPHLLLADQAIAILRSGTSQCDIAVWSSTSHQWETVSDRWTQFAKARDDVHAVVL